MELDTLLTERFGVELDRVAEIRREAGLARVPFTQALVMAGVCTEEALAEVLAEAVGSPLLELDTGAFDHESVARVPEGLARQHLLIPVSEGPAGRSLRVAFANPLERDAIAAVQEVTGLPVEPLVAPASAVLEAIDREYARPSTKVAPRPLRAEDTRKVALALPSEPSPVVDASSTAPSHKLDREATAEQRHEALLLALIERGVVTRADYLAALKRLLGHDPGTDRGA